MARFSLAPPPSIPVGTKIILSDFWNQEAVTKDTKLTFDRSPFHQITGSCVGAGGGNALYTLMAVQACLTDGATKAFIPFWPFNYGRARYLEGDRGQGDGAMGSAFAKQLMEGVISTAEAGLPKFRADDGLILADSDGWNAPEGSHALKQAQRLEFAWSDGGSKLVTDYLDEANPHPLGTAAPLRTPIDILASVINGYPGTIACDRYIGNASIQGSGDQAATIGSWDTEGGHQQWFFGVWNHPRFGMLYAIGNNWPRGTYPRDPGGLPLVTCWVSEVKVAQMFRYHAEVYAFSHLTWFPRQEDKIIEWADM
jgi:hypothetical protein